MIISASRRTDIPCFYSDWFLQRLKEQFVYVRNPFNYHQISCIDLSPAAVDCFVFWTKNPKPMLSKFSSISEYQYYVQFTLTGYGKDVEVNLPSKREVLIPTFIELSNLIGKERVIWRYDPILINPTYTVAYHKQVFSMIAKELSPYTNRVIISFLDSYAKIKKSLGSLEVKPWTEQLVIEVGSELAHIANGYGLIIESCAEATDLEPYGIKKGSCIDKNIVEQLIGHPIQWKKDRNQRKECGCIKSIDIGAYDTCINGCSYCYANVSKAKAGQNHAMHQWDSPFLLGEVGLEDTIKKRG